MTVVVDVAAVVVVAVVVVVEVDVAVPRSLAAEDAAVAEIDGALLLALSYWSNSGAGE